MAEVPSCKLEKCKVYRRVLEEAVSYTHLDVYKRQPLRLPYQRCDVKEGEKMKIIIVEDERKSLMGLTALIGQLEERWDIVGTAGNGEEGVRLIAREQPDVVITDVMMEQMDGLEMMEAIRNQGNECKFIVLSGYADFKFAQKAIQLGSVDYLLKPVTKKTLRAVLERVEQKIREEKYQIRCV